MDEEPFQPQNAAPLSPQPPQDPAAGFQPSPGFAAEQPNTPNPPPIQELQNVYPAAEQTQPVLEKPGLDQMQKEDHQSFLTELADIITLISGGASSIGYLLIIYLVKNLWLSVIISAALAITAIFFGFKSYSKSKAVTPFTVIGLSAATITIVFIANILISQAVARSLYE